MRVFAATGSRGFSFERLIRALDNADFKQCCSERVDMFVQIGSSSYIPKNLAYIDFLPSEEFAKRMDWADVVVTHGGTGAIVGALLKGKKVVAVPRLSKFHEAVDDHQVEFLKILAERNFIVACFDLEEIASCVATAYSSEFAKFESNTNNIIESISEFIDMSF